MILLMGTIYGILLGFLLSGAFSLSMVAVIGLLVGAYLGWKTREIYS